MTVEEVLQSIEETRLAILAGFRYLPPGTRVYPSIAALCEAYERDPSILHVESKP